MCHILDRMTRVGLLALLILAAILLGGCNSASKETPSKDSADLAPTPLLTQTLTFQTADSFSSSHADATPALAESTITVENVHLVKELARLGRGTINAVAVSPDERTLAVAGSLGVWLYDAQTLQARQLLEGVAAPVTDVAWSPDGQRLASAGEDGTIHIWVPSRGNTGLDRNADVVNAEQVLNGHAGPIASLAWSPDGKRLASGGLNGTIRIWMPAEDGTGTSTSVGPGNEGPTLTGHSDAVVGLDWSPDGTHLASASRDSTVRVWQLPRTETGPADDLAGGRQIMMFDGHSRPVTSVAWSPDETHLASASEDETVRIWSSPVAEADSTVKMQSRHDPAVLEGHKGAVTSVVWSPDGAQVASAGRDHSVRLWNVANSQLSRVLKGHTGPVVDVSWLPDGSGLVSGGSDGALRIWNAATGQASAVQMGHSNGVLSVSWSPDGTQLASGNSDGSVDVWSLAAGTITTGTQMRRLTGHRGAVNSVAWSPDGSKIASAGGFLDGKVLLWDASEMNRAQLLAGHTGPIESVTWSPEGSRLASASWDNTVRVWDDNGRPLNLLKGHTDWVLSLAWSPDGNKLASGSKDGTVRVWDPAREEQLSALKGHTNQVSSVTWSPDSRRLASASADGMVRIWDAAGGRPLLVLGIPGSLTSVAWSPDGTLLALASEFRDNLVWIVDASMDASTGKELHTLIGHVDTVKAVAWSPGGTHLATVSADGTVRVWGVPP